MAWRYLAEELPEGLAPGGLVRLEGEEARHAAVVARVQPGERIGVGDGRGQVAEGVVERADRELVEVRVDAVRAEDEPQPRLVLAQALAKNDRDELAVQAATELGAAGIIPWQAARSVSRWDARKREKGAARWRTIAREAAKQSLRAWVPEVAELAELADLARLAAEPGTIVLALEPSAPRRLAELAPRLAEAERVVLVVGPEGGIAPEELERLGTAGALAASLGSPVLRTSTAGPAAIAALCALTGRWGGSSTPPAESAPSGTA